jgi:hypothetical protein
MMNLATQMTHTLRRWNLLLPAVAFVFAAAIGCPNTQAQSGAGAIQGTVTDVTGAVIPGAAVHVINPSTSVASNTTSNSVGFYQVPDLFTGTYIVSFSAPGMKSYQTTIELQVAQAAIVNPVLTAGATTEKVEVAGDVVQLTTNDNGTISSTLENQRINQLPMNGRVLLGLLAETTPGFENGGGNSGYRANGLMSESLEFVSDGAVTTNRGFGGEDNASLSLLPDADSVQEVRMETADANAQYSTPATGIITTKSGTNSIHGSLFETARNNYFGVAKNRSNPASFAAPHLVRNEFGASAGGPVILPHLYHGKDKTFWFFGWEKYSLVQDATAVYAVDTPAMKGGDFSGLVTSAGLFQQLYDPTTTAPSANCNGTGAANQFCRAPFGNGIAGSPGDNQIPIGRLNQVSKIVYDMTPTPTNTNNPLVSGNYNFPGATTEFIPTITWRLDHNFNENNKAYLRYTSNNTSYTYPGGFATTIAADGIPAGAASTDTVLPSSEYAGALGFTHVFSPTFFSETVVSQQWFSQFVTATGDVHRDYESQLGLPNNFSETGFPGISGFVMGHAGNMYQYGISQIISFIDENLTKTLGRHQIQFGGRYRHERLGYQPDEGQDGVGATSQTTGLELPSSGANYSNTPNTGYAAGDAFLGSGSTYSAGILPPYMHYKDQEIDAYFQDNYHLTKNLTLNLGLRFEAHPSLSTEDGLLTSFDITKAAIVLTHLPSYYISKGFTTQALITNLTNNGVRFETSSQAGFPSTNLRSFNHTIGPRVGLAYLPFNGKHGTVLRGAYGRYIYPVPVRNTYENTGRDLPFYTQYTQNINSANQSPDSQINYQIRNPQYYFNGMNTTGAVNSGTTTSILPGIGGSFYNPDFPPIYITQTNFTVEQPLKAHSALRLTWLWVHGTNVDHGWYPNTHPSNFVWEMAYGTVPPTGNIIGSNQYAATATGPYNQTTFGSFNYSERSGYSNDNALQANYQRLFHHGIAWQVTYVWSRPFRLGGNSTRDGLDYPLQNYLGNLGTVSTYAPIPGQGGAITTPATPPVRPAGIAPYADFKALNAFQNYKLDSAIPLQHVLFNGIADLPFGRGKRFLGNSNRFVDELVGGFQLAGDGNIISQDFQPGSSNWGANNPIKVYKHGAPIVDCRSGNCYKEYEWFNGYVAPGTINAATKGVSGLPSNYLPYQTPINNTPGTSNYTNNNVNITLPGNPTPQSIAFAPDASQAYAGNNLYSRTFINGPMNYTVDLSLFKVFPITERTNLRFNVDAFNALNVQGYNNPNATDGTETVVAGGASGASSYNVPRQVQFTLRFTF